MRCIIEIDPQAEEPSVILKTASVNEELLNTVKKINSLLHETVLQGYCGSEVILLHQEDILRIYSQRQKVFAQTAQGEYLLRLRLYEAENLIDPSVFLRISASEIVNSRSIRKLDVSLSGTIGVYLDGGIKTYASRRYVARIKQFFQLRKGEKR